MSPPRARDRLGRPLPGAEHPAAFPTVPLRESVDTATALAEAEAYLADDLPFHAHEVFEQRWRGSPAAERGAWQALAQWAAGLTHAARGNGVGAGTLLRRAAAGLDGADLDLRASDGRRLDLGAMAQRARADADRLPGTPRRDLRWARPTRGRRPGNSRR